MKQKEKASSASDRNTIGSLVHGLSVLEAVGSSLHPISLSALSEKVCLTKTSTWRLVHTLVGLGYVRQDPRSRNFRPAPKALALGFAYLNGLDLKQLAAPFLQELSFQFNETINLAVIDGDELVYIDRICTSQIISINLHLGSRLPLYNTSLGRALICERPELWLREYMTRLAAIPEAREYLRAGRKNLTRLLDETRKAGFAINNQEFVKGLCSVASPIVGASGEIVGALGIAVPSSRVTVNELRRDFAPELIATAKRISTALGYHLAN